MSAENTKSDHYANRREGIHLKILNALPKPIRLSWLGKRYWRRVVRGDYSHFHCDPKNPCIYCEENTTLSRLDRVRYAIEEVIR